MNRLRLICACVLAGALLLGAPGRARASFEYTEVGPRAAAMGGTGVSRNPHVTGMFYNPANLAEVEQTELFTEYEKMWMGLTDGSNITRQLFAAGFPMKRGKWGHLGLAMQNFGLAGLYTEQTIGVTYGRRTSERFRWGLGMKQMTASYGQDEYTAVNPAFDGGTSATGMGLDFGVLYLTKKRLQWGFSLMNLNEPDVGIAYPNKVDRAVNIGLSVLRNNWEWHNQLTRTGTDIRIKTGIERFVTSRMSLRGGVNLGTRQYRNFSFGFAYIRNHLLIEYAMALPLGGVSGIMGHHKVGFTWKFGRKPDSESEFGDEEEEEEEEAPAEEGKEPAVVHATSTVTSAKTPAIILEMARKQADTLVSEALGMVDTAEYEKALKTLHKANDLPIEDPRYKELESRVAAVARLNPDIKGGYPKGRLVRRGITAFALGDGKTSIESLLYASQKYPSDKEIERMLDLAKRQYPDIATNLRPIQGLDIVEQKLEEGLSLIYSGQYTAAVTICEEVLALDPNNVLALVRQGSAYWALGRRETARTVWTRALTLDPGNKDVREFLERKDPAESAGPAASNATPKPAPQPAKAGSDDVKKQYQEQLDYYNRLKRMGVNKHMLELVLKQMIGRFEGTEIDMTYLKKEAEKY